jgi:hypothetical protein
MKKRYAAGGLIGTMMVVMAALAAIAAFLVVVAAVVAYLKRETWTAPAYRKARDRTGEWGVTPWSPGQADQPLEETDPEAPVESPEATA